MSVDTTDLTPTQRQLQTIFDMKHHRELGWGPRARLRFGYFTPDDHYEAVVEKLVQSSTRWADIGCGRCVLPSNQALAEALRKRCNFIFGIDPDPNIRENPYIDECFEGLVEECDTRHKFDLITMRMVAEHIAHPERSVAKIAELLNPGGSAVVYTPNKWAPISVIAALVPNRLHYHVKKLVWDSEEERDTFPTAFKLNTRTALRRHFAANGMLEIYFAYLDDCRTSSGFRSLNYLELTLQKMLRSMRITYPENCLIGIYRKAL